MSQIYEFPTRSGSSVLVELSPAEASGLERVSNRPGEIAGQAKETLEDALVTVQNAAIAFCDTVKGIPESPEEFEVEFRIRIGAKTGAFVVSADAEAQFAVKMTRRRPSISKG